MHSDGLLSFSRECNSIVTFFQRIDRSIGDDLSGSAIFFLIISELVKGYSTEFSLIKKTKKNWMIVKNDLPD
jgi:hypothetical protein